VPPVCSCPLGKGEPSARREQDLSLPRHLGTGFLEFENHFLLVPKVCCTPRCPPLQDSLGGAHLPITFSCVVLTSKSAQAIMSSQAPSLTLARGTASQACHTGSDGTQATQAWVRRSPQQAVTLSTCCAQWSPAAQLPSGWLFSSACLGWAPSCSSSGACGGSTVLAWQRPH